MYSGSNTSSPCLAAAATQIRTGPHARSISCRYSSERSLPWLSTARLITCQLKRTGRTCSTFSAQREASHAHGQLGSNQNAAVVTGVTGVTDS